jgi:hypothetical protein
VFVVRKGSANYLIQPEWELLNKEQNSSSLYKPASAWVSQESSWIDLLDFSACWQQHLCSKSTEDRLEVASTPIIPSIYFIPHWTLNYIAQVSTTTNIPMTGIMTVISTRSFCVLGPWNLEARVYTPTRRMQCGCMENSNNHNTILYLDIDGQQLQHWGTITKIVICSSSR